jgi:hypothetical protein
MATILHPEALLKHHMVRNGTFIDIAILSDLAGQKISKPRRAVESCVKDIISPTRLQQHEIILKDDTGVGKRNSLTYVKVRISFSTRLV